MIAHQLADDDVMVEIQVFDPETGFTTEAVPLSSLSYNDYPDLFAAHLKHVAELGKKADDWWIPENSELDKYGKAA